MITRRQLVLAAAAASAATPLAGCSGGNSGGSKEGGSIKWLSARSDNDTAIQAVKELAVEFAKDHEGFSLTVETVPDRPSYLQRVKILATSGDLPTWFDADPEPYFADIAETGAVADIDALYKELGVTDSFYPISIEYPKLPDGTLKLITWNANCEYFFYNKDVFAEAKVEEPKTLDDVLTVCGAIAKTGKPAIAIAGSDRWPYYRYLAMPAFRATANEFLMNLSEGKASMLDAVGIESSTYLQDIGTLGFQKGFTTTDSSTALNLVLNGDAGMYYTGTWDVASFLDDDGNLLPNIGIFRMPISDTDDVTKPTDFFVNSGIGTAIRADALDDTMKEFLKFVFKEYPNKLLYDYNTLPSIKPEIRDDLPQVYSDILDDIAGAEQYARVWDVVLDANTVETLARESESLTLGQSTPEKFGAAIDSAIKDYVAKK